MNRDIYSSIRLMVLEDCTYLSHRSWSWLLAEPPVLVTMISFSHVQLDGPWSSLAFFFFFHWKSPDERRYFHDINTLGLWKKSACTSLTLLVASLHVAVPKSKGRRNQNEINISLSGKCHTNTSAVFPSQKRKGENWSSHEIQTWVTIFGKEIPAWQSPGLPKGLWAFDLSSSGVEPRLTERDAAYGCSTGWKNRELSQTFPSQNQKVTKGRNWLGSAGTLRGHLVQPLLC